MALGPVEDGRRCLADLLLVLVERFVGRFPEEDQVTVIGIGVALERPRDR
jgi:hypothetical protein